MRRTQQLKPVLHLHFAAQGLGLGVHKRHNPPGRPLPTWALRPKINVKQSLPGTQRQGMQGLGVNLELVHPGDDLRRVPLRRPRLVRLAYRMLGSMAEAEDVEVDAVAAGASGSPSDK